MVDGEKYIADRFSSGEVYRVPIPVGRHIITYVVLAEKYRMFHGGTQLTTSDSALLAGLLSEKEIDVKKDQIFSISIKTDGPNTIDWGTSCCLGLACYTWPIGVWPLRHQKLAVDFIADNTSLARAAAVTKRAIVLGRVFSVDDSGSRLELTIQPGTGLRPGSVTFIFVGNKPVAKVVINQIFHTKASAKVITTTDGIKVQKDMPYGIMK
jgi:hypothetical protein